MRIAETHLDGYHVTIAVRAVGVQIRVEDPSEENATYERTIGGAPVLAAAIVNEIQTAIAGFQSAKTRTDANWAEVEKTIVAIPAAWTTDLRPPERPVTDHGAPYPYPHPSARGKPGYEHFLGGVPVNPLAVIEKVREAIDGFKANAERAKINSAVADEVAKALGGVWDTE